MDQVFHPESINSIFTPFYTTKSKGTGLGLAISLELATKLKGYLRCDKNDNGAKFVLELPQ